MGDNMNICSSAEDFGISFTFILEYNNNSNTYREIVFTEFSLLSIVSCIQTLDKSSQQAPVI